MKHFFILILFVFIATSSFSQSKFIVIDSILIEGNNRTKDYIITKELDIKEGDTIYFNKLGVTFQNNKNRVLNTGLFVDVSFNLKDLNTSNGSAKIYILVKESWYIFPKIIFDLVDRNFNVWFYENHASLKRINFGLGVEHKNLTGNNDALMLKFQTGVTKKIELEYSRPYLKKDNKIGFNFNVFYKFSKEIPYNTISNKLIYYRSKKNIFKQLRIILGFTFRPKIFDVHSVNLKLSKNKITDFVIDELNPNFFWSSTIQKYFSLSYSYIRDKRQYKRYPKGGYLLGGSLEKTGLGIFNSRNQLDLTMNFEKYFLINRNFISTYLFKVKYRIFGDESPYFNNKAIGYEEDLINGYELYVIDGKDFGYVKTAQKIKLFSGVFDFKNLVPIKQFNYIPYEIYLSINFDLGYVNNNVNFVNNSFNNRFLYGCGVGLDMVVYNNLINLNYSFNHIGEGGIFFDVKADF